MSLLIRVRMDGLATSKNVIPVYELFRRLNMVNDEIFLAFKNIVQMEIDEFLKIHETHLIRKCLPHKVADILVKELEKLQKGKGNLQVVK